jgi:hypothetical protein
MVHAATAYPPVFGDAIERFVTPEASLDTCLASVTECRYWARFLQRLAVAQGGVTLQLSDLDTWHFVCDEGTNQWSWRRVAQTGEEVAASPFSFASFRVCVADAERAGFSPSTTVVRRLRSSDIEVTGDALRHERRRRPRSAQAA